MISYTWKLVGTLCCNFGVLCVNEESEPHRDPGSRLAPRGRMCSLPHKDVVGPAPVPVSLTRGSREGNCRTSCWATAFSSRVSASKMVLDAEQGWSLCRHPGQPQPWRPEDGAGPLCNPCSGKGRAQGESRPQGNSFPGEAPAGTKSQSLWNRARH